MKLSCLNCDNKADKEGTKCGLTGGRAKGAAGYCLDHSTRAKKNMSIYPALKFIAAAGNAIYFCKACSPPGSPCYYVADKKAILEGGGSPPTRCPYGADYADWKVRTK